MITNAALARGLSRYRCDRLGPADWVTLARATLAVGVAALVADSFEQPAPVALLVTLAAVALVLDAVDGWVARRTGTASPLGAHFDGEVDAFLILVLSVYVARSAGAWVLAIGAARYAFLAAGWLLPWMREHAAAALLAQGRRRDAGDRADDRGCGRPAAGSDPGRLARRARPAGRVVRPRRVVAVEPPARHGRVTRLPASRRSHRAPTTRTRARRHRRRCSRSSPFWSCGSPSSLRPAEPSHARRVRAAPARGPRPRRPGRSSCPPRLGASWPASSGWSSAC